MKASLPSFVEERSRDTASRKRRRSIAKQFLPSQPLVLLWCLCFAVAIEVGYIVSIGAFSSGEFVVFFFGTSFGPRRNIQTIRDFATETIDDYFSRPHIREAVPLIVGGSDGSGTRAFVKILEQLDVPMLVEDRGTMDVHGKEMYNGAGWPALVTQVLNATKSVSYDLKYLPRPLVAEAREQIGRFLRSIKIAGRALVGTTAEKPWATSVLWGFKAPVSILLLPIFRDLLPAIKVLHIVRDGRDVALSDNHSPVQKFYKHFYSDAVSRNNALMEDESLSKDARANIKAMQLWNDWNKEAYEYGLHFSDGKSLDVLVMRTEDLIHHPLESVALLADFVGSLHSPRQLCCLSREVTTDLGQSGGRGMDVTGRGDEGDDSTLPGGARHVNVHDFSEIRKRFAEFHPSKSVDHHNDGNTGRRLMDQVKDADATDLFKSGGRVASAKHHQTDLLIDNEIYSDSHGHIRGDEMIAPGMSQVTRMQQLLQERRVTTQRSPEQLQSPEAVTSRYGKWMKLLDGDPALAERLHREGKEALSMFGYEPPKEFMDTTPHPEILSSCDKALVC